MVTHTRTRMNPPAARFVRSRRLAGGIGALALIGLAVAHTATNAGGFATDDDASWPLFLAFGVGLSLAIVAIAVVAWRYSRRGVGRFGRVVTVVAGVLCCAMAANVFRLHPEIILSPAGPGPWTLIGGPALLTAALLPVRRRGSAARSADRTS